jgi:hypothetical protein
LPEVPGNVQGDLVVILASTEFVSFATPFDASGRRFVAIRGLAYPPLNLPNVAPNVVAHEIGHAIGRGHNADPKLLMCGRLELRELALVQLRVSGGAVPRCALAGAARRASSSASAFSRVGAAL